ncbi:apolipoprotein N-acyltransferase [Paradesertivirga mongoliensis]|uniref:Apolipoprotein N-acyltransferase n=1 Tax=Paradesertivirga mongoliensis TaxID=2100740 RepID=A0ABW4ZKD7_9SPHI
MRNNYLLGITTAFTAWLAWPPVPYTSILLLIAFVPLLLAVENIIRSESTKKGKQVFAVSFFSFVIWNTSCIYWVFNSLNAVMPVAVAFMVSLIPFGLAALLMTIAFWLYYRLRMIKGRLLSYIGLISFWLGYEYLHQTWDLAFPWMNLGNGFSNFHQIVQWYEFTGVYGGSLWVLISNVLALEAYLALRIKSREAKKLIWAFSGVLALPILYSLTIYTNYQEKVNPSNIVVVQPNVDPYLKFGSPAAAQLQGLIRLSDSIGQPNTEYFIWPETAIPETADENNVRTDLNFQQVQNFLQKYPNANVLSGIESYLMYDSMSTATARYHAGSAKYYDRFNAAIQIENSARVQFYHKSKLVPGVEQTPFSSALGFMKPVFAAFGGSTGSYGRQDEPSVFYTQSGIGVAPVICYESIWGEYVSDYVDKGAQFIAIITNDGWWGNTSGKDQHLAYAKLRSIETRRWIARSANTGISAFINQRGDITRRSGWWHATALKENINLNDELTFYTRHGDYIAIAACILSGAFLALLVLNLIQRPKRSLK